MILIVSSVGVSAASIYKIPSLSKLFLGSTNAELNDGGKNHLPQNIYSVGGVFNQQNTQNIQTNYIGEADSDFINILTHGQSDDRAKNLDYSDKITDLAGQGCSVNPDYTESIITQENTFNLCYSNSEYEGVVFRLWDLEMGIKHMGDKPVLKGKEVCFNVEPDHQYLYDIMLCEELECNCDTFTNQYCQEIDGTLKMLRVRNCLPDKCDSEKVLVNWIDTTVEDCQQYENYCYESDGGQDYMHYGKTYFNEEFSSDRCINDNRLEEYYCEDGKVQSTFHYCLTTQICEKGECIDKPNTLEGCGVIDGKLRQEGYVWCVGTTMKRCSDGKLDIVPDHNKCKTPKCDYANILFEEGELVCMANGFTVIECQTPNSVADMFNYENCQKGTECKPSSRMTSCSVISPISTLELKDEVPKYNKTIWEWLFELLGDKK